MSLTHEFLTKNRRILIGIDDQIQYNLINFDIREGFLRNGDADFIDLYWSKLDTALPLKDLVLYKGVKSFMIDRLGDPGFVFKTQHLGIAVNHSNKGSPVVIEYRYPGISRQVYFEHDHKQRPMLSYPGEIFKYITRKTIHFDRKSVEYYVVEYVGNCYTHNEYRNLPVR